MKRLTLTTSAIALSFMIAACTAPEKADEATLDTAESVAVGVAEADHSVEIAEARAFLERAEAELAAQSRIAAQAYWNQATNITPETNAAAAAAGAVSTKLAVSLANESKQFDVSVLPADLARKMTMLRTGITIPAPSTPGAAEELSQITTGLDATYGTGKFTYKGEALNLDQLSTIIETSRDPEELKAVWEGWRTISVPMKDDYARMVEIANEGANELGFESLDQMWLSGYDMAPEEMEAEVQRLWTQVEPLYEELHCFTRAKLNEEYGDDVQPATGAIRADLLGNMWAQEWGNIYPLVAPEGAGDIGYDLTDLIAAKGLDEIQMVRTGEGFFSSLGFEPLPDTFWERSQFVKPRDREVVCHASAWDVDNVDDLRIKMCIKKNADDFVTIHHELGHNYYQRAYNQQDYLHLNGANDGFHEAIGDMIALSITPEYLVQIDMLDEADVPSADKDIGLLLRQAMDKVAFLPFGLMVDRYRWQLFDGTIPADQLNKGWNDLRLEYQGIVPPVERDESGFDAGAKYHIPGNVPYTRYFLARILQFQFFKAACDQAGWEGPLHRCSFYGNEEVGKNLAAMLEMGASKPWPDALEAFTGERQMSGTAMVEYFAPLKAWLDEQNAGQTEGW